VTQDTQENAHVPADLAPQARHPAP